MGVLKFGALLRYIPYPVIAGFTTGIAVIIFLGQTPALLGLDFAKPSHAPELLWELLRHAAAANWHTAVIGGAGLLIFHFEGPLFFAAVEKLEYALRSHGGKPRTVVFRLRHVPAMDTSALHSLEVALEKMRRDGVNVLFTAVQPQPMRVLFRSGLADRIGLENFCANIHEAPERARMLHSETP
jgi:MFS superfamily sulfate permease-like transporter